MKSCIIYHDLNLDIPKEGPMKKLYLTALLTFSIFGLLYSIQSTEKVSYDEVHRFNVLFTALNESDSMEIIKYLKNKKIPYSISSDAKEIKVRKDRITQVRLEIAMMPRFQKR